MCQRGDAAELIQDELFQSFLFLSAQTEGHMRGQETGRAPQGPSCHWDIFVDDWCEWVHRSSGLIDERWTIQINLIYTC